MSVCSNSSISIAICDDEPNDLTEIESITKELLAAEKISCGISKFRDAASLLSVVEGGAAFDILLLDVMMEHLDGMELAAALRKKGNDAAIIFISINRDMALLGYDTNIFLKRLIIYRPLLYNEDGDEK